MQTILEDDQVEDQHVLAQRLDLRPVTHLELHHYQYSTTRKMQYLLRHPGQQWQQGMSQQYR